MEMMKILGAVYVNTSKRAGAKKPERVLSV